MYRRSFYQDRLGTNTGKTHKKGTVFSQVSQISTQIPHESLIFEIELGRGGYGIVYRGKWRDLDVAMKAVEIRPADSKRVQLEKDIFLSLTHPSLVQCYGTSEQPAVPAQVRMSSTTQYHSVGQVDGPDRPSDRPLDSLSLSLSLLHTHSYGYSLSRCRSLLTIIHVDHDKLGYNK